MAFRLRDPQGRELPITGRLQLGRDPLNQIALDDPLASRVHATLWEEGGKLFIRDEQSSNGTFVNQKRIQETRLRPRDQIQIGNSVFQVASGPVPEAGRQGAAVAQAVPVQAGPAAASGRPAPTDEQASPVAAPRKRRRAGAWVLMGCLGLLLAGCGAGVGGYLAYDAGLLTPQMLLGLVGLGPADIEVDNFREDGVYVSVVQLDAPSDSLPQESSLELNPFDVRTARLQHPGRYQIDFGTSSDAADLGSCTLSARSGELYQFVTLPDMVVINRVKDPVTVGSDLIVATSTLCR